MAYDWTIIEEGSSLSASDLNDRFTAVKDEINDLLNSQFSPHLFTISIYPVWFQ